jgi:DNA replication and repair protein RecF
MSAQPRRDDSPDPALRRVRRIVLGDFRSYAALDLSLDAPMAALTGDNGAGKTNLVEALSLFAQGRGLRRADLGEMARQGGRGGFAVSIELETADGLTQLGTGLEPADDTAPATRRCRIDRAAVASPRAFSDHLRLVWLTPAMDGLFAGSAGDRRRFLDRLVLSVDADHGARVSALERALRNRNRLLEEARPDALWLDAAEHEVAELGVAVAAARAETVSRLAALIAAGRDATSPFPFAEIDLVGDVEALVVESPALAAEEAFRRWLRDSRARDAAAGRALIGPQTADLRVRHGPKQVEAALCSTGEQKALLVGLVLAQARLVAAMSGLAPLVLLDEIAAHFDPARRAALFAALAGLGGQVWLTGADPAAFAAMPTGATVLEVAAGGVRPRPRTG